MRGDVVLKLEFTPADLANTRFAISPLWEVVAAVRVLKTRTDHPVHAPWAAQVRPRLAASGLDWSILAELVPDKQIPGFLAPPPNTPIPNITLELATMRATAAQQVRASLDDLDDPRGDVLAALYADPQRGLAELV